MLDGEGRVEVRPKNPQADAYRYRLGWKYMTIIAGDSPDAVLHVAVTIDQKKKKKKKITFFPLSSKAQTGGFPYHLRGRRQELGRPWKT